MHNHAVSGLELFVAKFCTGSATPVIEPELPEPPEGCPPGLAHKMRHDEGVRRKFVIHGTSFFFNFDWTFHLHQIEGPEGIEVRHNIGSELLFDFVEALKKHLLPDVPTEPVLRRLLSKVCHNAEPAFNNGEVYFWLQGLQLDEDFAFQFLRDLKAHWQTEPATIRYGGSEHPIPFCGWGIRYF